MNLTLIGFAIGALSLFGSDYAKYRRAKSVDKKAKFLWDVSLVEAITGAIAGGGLGAAFSNLDLLPKG